MKPAVCIVHYNTPRLTTALVQSINLHSPGCRIIIFDNSDRSPFPETPGVEILDNTKGQLIDFDAMIRSYPHRRKSAINYGTERHIASVDWMFDYVPDGFILLDSDVLLKKDIRPLIDASVPWTGSPETQPWETHTTRLAPYLLWINVPFLREHGIRFRHEGRFFQLSHNGAPYYDTGGSLYHDCLEAGLSGKEIDIYDYIIHFGQGSYGKDGSDVFRFLENYKHLYTMAETKKTTKAKVKPAEEKDDKILVVIPYCSKGAQGRELEYAVTGWRRHFKENYLIVLAGENHPITETGDDIICIESERVPEKKGNYRQHLDYVSCLKKVHAAFPNSKGFIMVADDCYAINDFDLTDVKLLKQRESKVNADINSFNAWQRDKAKTKMLLEKEGYPTRGFTTHLPQYYEWDKLEALWEKYDMANTSYVMEDLYYNIYYPTRVPLQLHIDFDNFKCGVYRPNPRKEYIDRAFSRQIWLQNSPEGWIPYLETVLKRHYCID